MWTNEECNVGWDTYSGTIEALKNLLAKVADEWIAEIAIATDAEERLYFVASERKRALNRVEWENGILVIFAIRYGDEGEEEEETYEVMVTFQRDDGEDYEKELEIIDAILHAWVEEKVFPNARMAINVQSLLHVKEVQELLKKINFPAYIKSQSYRP